LEREEKMKPIEFQLCSESDNPTDNPNHIANIKHDGRRVIVCKEGNNISLFGRDPIRPNNYSEIITVFQKINSNFIADCEFVVFTNGMKTDRGLLQSVDRTQDKFKIRLLKDKYPATAVVFDLLEFNGQDLRNEEYQKRKQMLSQAFSQFPSDIEGSKEPIKIAKDLQPKEAWELAQKHQLEGIVEKDIHSKYIGKRSPDWVKIKRKEIVIKKWTGYEVSNAGITLTNPEGDRVACHGEQHKAVKELIDTKGYALCAIRSMAGITERGRRRELVFYELVKEAPSNETGNKSGLSEGR
jgi:ATP-dependent DNA ligase